ncbi:MAG: DUF2437 domain-containing protein [SAR202 cluster bacterium]|nr:DUF2437 domain-containing protein [SAR202 cluster bacterium]
MKFCRFETNGWQSYGVVEGDRIRVIQGDLFGEHRFTEARYDIKDVRILPPTKPQSFWAVGLNYADHVAHQIENLDAERIARDAQTFRPWQKGVSSIIGQDDTIILPKESDYVHYEGELVIVIGKPAKRITPEEAPNFILGYTCGNDVSSEGSWHDDPSNWRKKTSDTFGPVGPWIETDLDPQNVEIITKVNGKETDRGSTSGMTFNCYETVSRISQHVTLHPGDLILTGAPGAVEGLESGQVVEVEIPEIGTLRNVVAAEE